MSDVAKLTIKVTTDVSRAARELSSLDAGLRRVASSGDRASSSLRGNNEQTDRTSSSMRRAAEDTDRTARSMDNLGNSSNRSNLDMRGLLISLAIVAGTSLAPVIGASTGALIALGGVATSVGLGLGVFGLALSAIGKNKDGTLVALNGMRTAFESWGKAEQKITMKPIEAFTKILPGALNMLNPILLATSNALTKGVVALGGWLKSKEAATNVKALTAAFTPMATNLGGALGNFLRGLLNLFVAFLPVSVKMTGGIKGLSDKFLQWSQTLDKNQGFQKFVKFVETEGPKVWGQLGQLIVAVSRFVIALIPLGTIVLNGLVNFVVWIGKLNPAVIQAIAVAVSAMILAFKGGAIISAVADAIGALSGVALAPVLAVVAAVVALAAGFVLLYRYSAPFRTLVNQIWGDLGRLASLIAAKVQPVLDSVGKSIQNNILPALNGFFTKVSALLTALQPLFNLLGKVASWLLPLLGAVLSNVVVPALAQVINFFGRFVDIMTHVVNAGTYVVNFFVNNFGPAMNRVGQFFVGIWNSAYQGFFNILHNIENWAVTTWNHMYGDVANWIGNIKNTFERIWNDIYTFFGQKLSQIKSGAVTAWRTLVNDVKTWFGKIKTTITNAFTNAKGWLVQAGKDVWNGFVAGMKSVVDTIAKTIGNWGGTIIKAVKGVFGIKSPSTVMHGLGIHMMTGFINGMMSKGTDMGSLIKMAFGITGDPFEWLAKNLGGIGKGILTKVPELVTSLAKKIPSIIGKLGSMGKGVMKLLGGLFGGGGGGSIPSKEHSALLTQAAALAGVPNTWVGPMNTLVTRESGWNPNAINRTDSNAEAGHPSQGLAQTIPSTFAAYALPGLGGILNPLANLVAAMRYIKATYGSIFNVQQAVGKTPMGYATGGYARGLVKVGENGPELFDAGSGGHVYTAKETKDMMAGSGGGDVHVNYYGTVYQGSDEDAAKVAFKVRTHGMGWRTR